MAKIALIRGHHLSKEETLSYEILKDEFQFTCFSTNAPWYDQSEIVFPIVQVPCVERLFHFLPWNWSHRFFGLQDKVLGTGQWMLGINKRLKDFDVVHTSDYCHLFSYQVAKAKERIGFKLVAIHYENIPFARSEMPLVRLTKPTIYKNVDAFFAMSERARSALLLEGVAQEKIHVIGNAVDTRKFRARPEHRIRDRRSFGLQPEDTVVLFIGRLHETKGVLELLYAAKKLVCDPDVDSTRLRIVIAGSGNLEKTIRQRIQSLGIANHVRLLGKIPHSEIHLLHNAADVFTLPSIPRKHWQEQFGIVLIESMACQTPVVSTLCGSIPEVVGNCGALVQPNDHIALYEGLKRLITNEELRKEYGQKGRERVERLFSPDAIGNRLRQAYDAVLQSSFDNQPRHR